MFYGEGGGAPLYLPEAQSQQSQQTQQDGGISISDEATNV